VVDLTDKIWNRIVTWYSCKSRFHALVYYKTTLLHLLLWFCTYISLIKTHLGVHTWLFVNAFHRVIT